MFYRNRQPNQFFQGLVLVVVLIRKAYRANRESFLLALELHINKSIVMQGPICI